VARLWFERSDVRVQAGVKAFSWKCKAAYSKLIYVSFPVGREVDQSPVITPHRNFLPGEPNANSQESKRVIHSVFQIVFSLYSPITPSFWKKNNSSLLRKITHYSVHTISEKMQKDIVLKESFECFLPHKHANHYSLHRITNSNTAWVIYGVAI